MSGQTITVSDFEGILRHLLKFFLHHRAQEIYPEHPDQRKNTDTRDPRNWNRYPERGWLSELICFPQLVSDVLVVLDCFLEGLSGPDSPENIQFLSDDDYSWARYSLLIADYAKPSTVPGRLSNQLMSLLEELATSKRFYAREGLITSGILQQMLGREVKFDDDLVDLHWFGNDGVKFIHLSPLRTSERLSIVERDQAAEND